jgi:hypothetical protein
MLLTPSRSIIPRVPLLFTALVAASSWMLSGCGDRITPAHIEDISRAVADVMVAVQKGADSTDRYRIADSVARRHGFDDWAEIRDEVGVIATEPERLRSLLDTTQRRIEARAR